MRELRFRNLQNASVPCEVSTIHHQTFTSVETARFLAQIKVLITAQEIQDRIQEMGTEISRAYAGQELVVVPLLKGSFIFAADLLRRLTLHPQVEFINASSYGNNTISSGTVKLYWPPGLNLEGKEVLVVEDIVDSGTTLARIEQQAKILKPASMRYVSLLYKDRGPNSWPMDWYGFKIPDVFVVGYGLDYQQLFRNLPYIGVVAGSEDTETEVSQARRAAT